MNKRYLDYAIYTIWANNRLIHDLMEHDDSIMTKELIGSFATIRDTVKHIWYAETGWLSRLQGKGFDVQKVSEFQGSNLQLFNAWQLTTEAFKDFTRTADLEKEIQFEQKGFNFSIPTSEIIQTVCNHGTYHRGQIVNMLRQLSITKISQADYIEWVREKQRGNL